DPRALDNHGSRPEIRAALAGGTATATRHSDTENRDFQYYAVAIRDEGRLTGIARVSTPVSAINADLRRIAATVFVAAAGAVVAAGVLAVLIAGAVTRPLWRLRHAARALADGGF